MKMQRAIPIAALILSVPTIFAQPPAARPAFDAFEVATVKPVEGGPNSNRFIRMDGTHRFIETNYTLKLLIAAAYNMNPETISGGPGWIESDRFDITAITPGEVQPTHDEQMKMLRALLTDRFKLTFHREPKVFSIYEMQVANPRAGPKFKPSTTPADQAPQLVGIANPEHIHMPARNATMGDFVSLLQRAILDRPVVDKTGLTGRFDFDLDWAPDDSQFSGDVKAASADSPSPPFFTAIQQQLGLRLVATRGQVNAIVADNAERPTVD